MDEVTKSGISKELIQRRLSGLKRGELPPDSTLVIGIDIGKLACHWTVGAFRRGGAGSIVNYGVIEVIGTETTSKPDVIERSILRALIGWKDHLASHPFCDADDNPIEPAMVLIDSGYCADAVSEFVRLFGEPYRATKGIGSGKFHHGTASVLRRVGANWFAQRQPNRTWLYSLNADHWKRSVHDRFVAEPHDDEGRPRAGSLTLFIPTGKRDHLSYASHLMAEEWVTEFVPGKGERSGFIVNSGNNHYLDATALCLAGAEMAGCGLFEARARVGAGPRPTMAELAAKGRR